MKIVGAQINVTLGALKENAAKIIERIKTIAGYEGVNLIVFPELSITGYPPADLLFQSGFVEEQLTYVDQIREATADLAEGVFVVIGAVTLNEGRGKRFRNSLLVFERGREVLRYHKQLLPTYNVFDENRYFEAGVQNQNNVLQLDDDDDTRVGFLICEDAWNDDGKSYDVNPWKNLGARSDVNAVVTINASPSHVGKKAERFQMYRKLAHKYQFPIIYVNQVGAHDALIFDGSSFVVDGHGVLAYTASFEEGLLRWDEKAHTTTLDYTNCKPREVLYHLLLGIKDYVHKNGFKKIVVGSSGGIDSAVVLALATLALGQDNVFAITMPSKFSSEGSVNDSVTLCDNLGVKLYERPIMDEVELSIKNFKIAFQETPSRLTIENEQARIRGRILMEFSNHFGALVLSTGNKSEMSVGYATIYGDMCGGLAVIADLYKMEVYLLAETINSFAVKTLIPEEIIYKAPSAELWEGQKDTDSLPPYPVLDALLKLYIERDYLTPEEITENQALIKGLSLDQIEKYLKMTDRAEFKRQQAPPILRVHNRAFGFGRTLPITQKYNPSYKNVV